MPPTQFVTNIYAADFGQKNAFCLRIVIFRSKSEIDLCLRRILAGSFLVSGNYCLFGKLTSPGKLITRFYFDNFEIFKKKIRSFHSDDFRWFCEISLFEATFYHQPNKKIIQKYFPCQKNEESLKIGWYTIYHKPLVVVSLLRISPQHMVFSDEKGFSGESKWKVFRGFIE